VLLQACLCIQYWFVNHSSCCERLAFYLDRAGNVGSAETNGDAQPYFGSSAHIVLSNNKGMELHSQGENLSVSWPIWAAICLSRQLLSSSIRRLQLLSTTCAESPNVVYWYRAEKPENQVWTLAPFRLTPLLKIRYGISLENLEYFAS